MAQSHTPLAAAAVTIVMSYRRPYSITTWLFCNGASAALRKPQRRI
jgi:hypothetical protein